MSLSSVSSNAPRPDRDRLTPSQRDELWCQLIDARASLRERALMIANYDGSFDATAATRGRGETEHTTIDIERHVNAVLEGSARDALAETASALERMDEGTYGLCQSCTVAIPYARLRARPTARLCVACQTRQDGNR